jgi:hypothetical protein
MSARSRPYPAAGCRIRIAGPLWRAALETVRHYGRRRCAGGRVGSEALVYLGGVVAANEMIVTTLYRLGHLAQGGRVVAGGIPLAAA